MGRLSSEPQEGELELDADGSSAAASQCARERGRPVCGDPLDELAADGRTGTAPQAPLHVAGSDERISVWLTHRRCSFKDRRLRQADLV